MDSVHNKFAQFKSQCHSENDIVKIQDLNKQISRLQQKKNQPFSALSQFDKQQIQRHIKTYRLAAKQIERMKMQFTKPSLLKLRLTQIFDNKKQQLSFQLEMSKTSEIKTSQIQLPSFKNTNFKIKKQNIINQNQEQYSEHHTPTLKKFFQKKQSQIMSRTGVSPNFKTVLMNQQNTSFSKNSSRPNNSNRSVSREQPSRASKSSASSFNRKPNTEAQLKKVLQQNKKMREQYDKRLKRQLQLNEFEKNLLKQQKNRYMTKIQELQVELQSIYRDNYKLKQQQTILKQKQKIQKLNFDNSSSFKDVDENVHGNQGNSNDFYQPYVMKTKHNDLKKLNMKNTETSNSSALNRSIQNFFQQNSNKNQTNSIIKNPFNPHQDILGSQLQKQLQQIQKSKQKSQSNHSQRSSHKKWSKDYNGHISKIQKQKNSLILQNPFNNNDHNDIINVLNAQDQEEEKIRRQVQNREKYKNPINFQSSHKKNDPFLQFNQKNAFQKKNFANDDDDNMILKELATDPEFNNQQNFRSSKPTSININVHGPPGYVSDQTSKISVKTLSQSIDYRPSPNYSFKNTNNNDYNLNNSNNHNYDTFDMTRTYLNMSDNQQESQTNKYIDSKTSTRNKVAFFKESLILIKNQTFQLAYKKSALVNTKDRVRIIFFIKNKTSNQLKVNFNYEYDSSYFNLKINQKLTFVTPNGQSRQDLQIYAFSTNDLNQVIDILVEVNSVKYGLWMPISWIQFIQSPHFKMPNYNQEITIVPDRQFKSYDTAKTMMPLLFGGIQGMKEWAYLYGISKFGPCFVKLTWENKQLTIQTNSKWIDLLAFIMHHVK